MSRVRDALGIVSWSLLLATLVLLPYESWLPQIPAGPLTVTTLEAVWMAAVASWLGLLLVERRLPRVSSWFLVVLGGLLVAGVASAVLANGYKSDALTFVGRTATGWLLFLAVADQVTAGRSARTALGAIVAGATVAALIGLVIYFFPGLIRGTAIPQFYAAGARRLNGPFDYPNTAAMAWEATALLAVSLAALANRRATRWLAVVCAIVIVAATLLTLTRGAAIGWALGLVVIAALAFLASRRRLATALAGSAVVLVVLTISVEVIVAPVSRLFSDSETGLYDASYQAPAAVALESGNATMSVRISNTGTLTWNASPADHFVLGFHWLDPSSSDVLADGDRTFAVGIVQPGQSVTVQATVDAPNPTVGGLLAWDMRYGSSWFSLHEVPVLATQVEPQGTSADPSALSADTLTIFSDEAGPTRTELWTAATKMFLDSPLLGVGPGTFRLRYGVYAGLGNTGPQTHSNNLYLELASTTGLIGLCLFLAVVLLAVVPLATRLVRDGPHTGKAWCLPGRTWLGLAALLAAVVAFLGHGLVDYFFAFNPTNGLWWSILGLVVAAPAIVPAPQVAE